MMKQVIWSCLCLSCLLYAEDAVLSTEPSAPVVAESPLPPEENLVVESPVAESVAPSDEVLADVVEIVSDPTPVETEEVALGEPLPSAPIVISPAEPVVAAPPLVIKQEKSAFVAVLMSSFVPGLGHYYLGEPRVATELLGGALLGGAGTYMARNDPALYTTGLVTVQSISLYGVYAAYRDAKLYNGNALDVMPRENFKNLVAAPFQWSVIKKPEVWGGCLGALAAGSILAYFVYPEEAAPVSARIKTSYIEPLSALPIALGEESFFRGLLQTALLEGMSPGGAITLSSLLFGAAHIPNAMLLDRAERKSYYAFSVPFITGLGAYLGWLTYKNHSLKESVAVHAWYDFALMCAEAFAHKASIGGETRLSYAFEF